MNLDFSLGLPNVYQVYHREVLRRKAFRWFFFLPFFGSVYQMSTKVIF